MNDDIRRMLKVAKSYNTNLAAVKMSAHLCQDLPAWYHIDNQLASISSRAAKCLLTKHQVTTVADLVKMSVCVRNPHPPEDHRPNPFCPCRDCTTDQEKGCYNPHNCATEALTRLERISPRLSPLGPENPQDLLSLTPMRKATNTQARLVNNVITFDPTLTCNTNLAECFCVFVDPLRLSAHPTLHHPPSGRNPFCPLIIVYTNRACMNNSKCNASCRGGVWAGPNNPLNCTIRVPGPDQLNQVGEIAAIIVVVASIPLSQPLQIISDSKYTIDSLTSHLHSWENQGWIKIKNADFFKRAAYLLRHRTAPTYFKWVKGHDRNDGNEQSDRLAKEGAINPTPDVLDLSVLDNFNIQGAKLRLLTQALAYRGICNSRPPHPQPLSVCNTQRAREAILHYSGIDKTNAAIWASIWKKPIHPKISQFLFKTFHNTYKVGDYWTPIQAVAERRLCIICGTTESMSHILLQCQCRPTHLIWHFTKGAWPYDEIPWPEIDLSIILGCGCIALPCPADQATPGTSPCI